jgi:hypothetical protein
MAEITPKNLLKIGFVQDGNNPHLFARHDGKFEFNPKTLELKEAEKADSVEAYVKWRGLIEREIMTKLQKK